MDSLSIQLGTLLNILPADFASMFHKRSLSFVLALDTFLTAFEQERPFDMLLFQPTLDPALSKQEAKQELLNNLIAINADSKTSIADWKRFLSGTNGNIENAIELNQLYDEMTSQEGSANLVDLAKNLPDAPAQALIHSEEEWSTVTRIEIIAQPLSASSRQCSRLAQDYRARAMDARREAQRHAQAGRGANYQSQGERAAAMHWSEKSMFFFKRATEWEQLGAQHLVSERQ